MNTSAKIHNPKCWHMYLHDKHVDLTLTRLRCHLVTAGGSRETLWCLWLLQWHSGPALLSTAGCFSTCWLRGHCHHRCIHEGTGIKVWHWGSWSSSCEIVLRRCLRRNAGAPPEDAKVSLVIDLSVSDLGESRNEESDSPSRVIPLLFLYLHTTLSNSWLLTVSPLICRWIFVHI